MNNNTYFIINNTKYIIIYEKTAYKIYKEIDNKLENLTEEEQKGLDFVINQKTPEYHESKLLDEALDCNKELKLYGNMKFYLEQLERLIPEHLRYNFYNNLKTVKIIYNDYSIRGPRKGAIGRYTEKDNTIVILVDALEQSLLKKGYSKEEVIRGIDQCILHEFVHMASSSYDKEKEEGHSGFDQDKFLPNTSITEGLTDVISIIITKSKLKLLTGYNMDRFLINQLIILTNWDLMINSFFGERGTKDIENYLNDLGKDHGINPSIPQELFRRINTNYILRDISSEFNELENIQNTILMYLDLKLNRLEEEGKFEEIDKTIKMYSNWLLTPKKIEELGYSTKVYINLDKNEKLFNEIVDIYQNRKNKSL